MNPKSAAESEARAVQTNKAKIKQFTWTKTLNMMMLPIEPLPGWDRWTKTTISANEKSRNPFLRASTCDGRRGWTVKAKIKTSWFCSSQVGNNGWPRAGHAGSTSGPIRKRQVPAFLPLIFSPFLLDSNKLNKQEILVSRFFNFVLVDIMLMDTKRTTFLSRKGIQYYWSSITVHTEIHLHLKLYSFLNAGYKWKMFYKTPLSHGVFMTWCMFTHSFYLKRWMTKVNMLAKSQDR